eukprot:EC815106.1.p2 GENE.EC815106.1~~EC815106.1.p2  ORF type:complete len:139 (-),score=38.54 EC815106.1:140-556(-)
MRSRKVRPLPSSRLHIRRHWRIARLVHDAEELEHDEARVLAHAADRQVEDLRVRVIERAHRGSLDLGERVAVVARHDHTQRRNALIHQSKVDGNALVMHVTTIADAVVARVHDGALERLESRVVAHVDHIADRIKGHA